jgi:glycosyltransferase involved in cell wall biosynthesis
MKDSGLPLILVGHRRDQAYADQVFAEGGARVRYLGPLDHDDPRLASAMAACAAFVLPSTIETPGLAALEAAACGAPVVITSEGSTREYFADYAHYVDPADPADIRRGLDCALAQGRNPALRPHVTGRFTWPAVTADLARVYRLVLERRGVQIAEF